ncbi:MAG: DUF1326 domain-containing protein [Gemmatimonadota bacterium]
MKRRDFSKMLGAAALVPVLRPLSSLGPLGVDEPRAWSFVADVSECCSCEIPCGCNFGRPERDKPCHGTRLIQIREGQIDGASLAGINFAVTFWMGQWTRIYIDDSMSQAQFAAVDEILPAAFGGFDRGARVKERVPLTIEREPGQRLRYSVPESTVEMRLLPGLDGQPIRVAGLPNPAYQDYVQYESVVHTHEGPDAQWSYEGTNGFQSVMRVSG